MLPSPQSITLPQRIGALISDQIVELDEAIDENENLFSAGLDSMALMQLILLLEQELGVSIGPEDLSKENFQTLSSIAQLVERKRSSPTPG